MSDFRAVYVGTMDGDNITVLSFMERISNRACFESEKHDLKNGRRKIFNPNELMKVKVFYK